MIKNGLSPGAKSTTGIKYLNVGKNYIFEVVVSIKRKKFIVWKGHDKNIGEKIAKKVQSIMLKGDATFLDWYDNEMERWLQQNGY